MYLFKGDITYVCTRISLYVCIDVNNTVVGKVFANGQGDQGSIPGQVIPKT